MREKRKKTGGGGGGGGGGINFVTVGEGKKTYSERMWLAGEVDVALYK